MGYRSDVGGVFSVDEWWQEPETDDLQKEQIAKYKEMIGLIKLSKFYELMSNKVDRTCIGWKGGEFYFHAENWKWYPDYDVVQAWDELWEQMQGVEGISGYFCRVGEETNDVTEESFGDNPDYDAFAPITYLNCEVSNDVFGKGDIDGEFTSGEVENLTMLEGEAI